MSGIDKHARGGDTPVRAQPGSDAEPAGGAGRRGRLARGGAAGTDGAATRAGHDELNRTVVALTGDEVTPVERRRLLGRLTGQIGRAGARLLVRPRGGARWMSDMVLSVAPHLQIRDLETLRAHHPGLDDEALAVRLIRNASRVNATVGAAGGGLSAMEWSVPPTLLSAPVLLASETIAVVAVEIKMIGELHEVYRLPVPGNGRQRALSLVGAWAGRRVMTGSTDDAPDDSADPGRTAGRSLSASLGVAARRELRDRLLRRFGRNLTTLGPLLTGAAIGAELNRRATRALGARVQDDLRSLALRPSGRELSVGEGSS